MAILARCVNCLMIPWCLGVGLQGCWDMIARVPTTFPRDDKMGVDQHALTPWDNIVWRHRAHAGSDRISEATTCSMRETAAAQGPPCKPISRPLNASLQLLGKLGAAPI